MEPELGSDEDADPSSSSSSPWSESDPLASPPPLDRPPPLPLPLPLRLPLCPEEERRGPELDAAPAREPAHRERLSRRLASTRTGGNTAGTTPSAATTKTKRWLPWLRLTSRSRNTYSPDALKACCGVMPSRSSSRSVPSSKWRLVASVILGSSPCTRTTMPSLLRPIWLYQR